MSEYRPEARGHERLQAVLWEIEPTPEAVPVLCRALADPIPDVREGAACKLTRCGDHRAVGPLTRALQETAGGRGWLFQRARLWLGVALFGITLAGAGMLLFWDDLARMLGGLLLLGASIVLKDHLKERGEQSRLRLALSEALATIAEREPSPEARAALTPLRRLASDGIQQDAVSRDACRRAAERIDAATRDTRSLPVTAAAPEPELHTLPLPTGAAEASEEEALPRVRRS